MFVQHGTKPHFIASAPSSQANKPVSHAAPKHDAVHIRFGKDGTEHQLGHGLSALEDAVQKGNILCAVPPHASVTDMITPGHYPGITTRLGGKVVDERPVKHLLGTNLPIVAMRQALFPTTAGTSVTFVYANGAVAPKERKSLNPPDYARVVFDEPKALPQDEARVYVCKPSDFKPKTGIDPYHTSQSVKPLGYVSVTPEDLKQAIDIQDFSELPKTANAYKLSPPQLKSLIPYQKYINLREGKEQFKIVKDRALIEQMNDAQKAQIDAGIFPRRD